MFVDQIDCMQVNITAADELLKKNNCDLQLAESKLLAAKSQTEESQSQNEFLRAQVNYNYIIQFHF